MLFLFAACPRRTEDTVDWTLARRIIAFIGGNQGIVINGELLRICVNFIGMDNGRWTLCLHVFFILLLALIMELSVHKLCVNTFRFSSLVLLGVIYCLLLVRTNSFQFPCGTHIDLAIICWLLWVYGMNDDRDTTTLLSKPHKLKCH